MSLTLRSKALHKLYACVSSNFLSDLSETTSQYIAISLFSKMEMVWTGVWQLVGAGLSGRMCCVCALLMWLGEIMTPFSSRSYYSPIHNEMFMDYIPSAIIGPHTPHTLCHYCTTPSHIIPACRELSECPCSCYKHGRLLCYQLCCR